MEPQFRFCTAADGVRIAYATEGDGPPLVVVPPWDHNTELYWNAPLFRSIAQAMAGHTLVRSDRRGVGASQREIEDVSLEAFVSDVSAVLDALGPERVDLFGVADAAVVAIAYAAQSPDRVSRLVLEAPYSCGADIGGLERHRGLIELIRSNWPFARRAIADIILPQGPTDLQILWAKVLRHSMSAEVAAKNLEFIVTVDIRTLLPRVRAPTLVLHSKRDRRVAIWAGRAVASQIPNARFVPLGLNPDPEEREPALLVIKQFLDEGRVQPGPDAPSGTVQTGVTVILFADIADSTALTERLGDDAFRERARALDGALRAIIRESSGTCIEAKTLGDGVLAVFTSARRAIEAAFACARFGADAGLPLHLGLHAGDVISEEGNVYGGAVNIASRISGLSAPGEVLVSETVRSLARTSAGVRFEDRGRRRLKGVGEAMRVWAVRAEA